MNVQARLGPNMSGGMFGYVDRLFEEHGDIKMVLSILEKEYDIVGDGLYGYAIKVGKTLYHHPKL